MTSAEPWDVPGQERAVAVLRGAAERDEVSHAWAFLGPIGVGQERAARWLAAALNCDAMTPPCGVCSICTRSLRAAHPAQEEWAPTGAFHRVDEVRGVWLPTAYRTAAEGRWKVLRIVDADRMNESAANAFLKGLEEPPPRTVWILDIADAEDLPDTILSRCRIVRFSPWSLGALHDEALRLGITDPQDRSLAVRAALGSPVTLRRLAAPEALDDYRAHRAMPGRLRQEGPGVALLLARAVDDEVKRRTAALKADGKAEIEALAEQSGNEPPRGAVKQLNDRLARREREAKVGVVLGLLDDMVTWYRDCLLVGAGGDPAAAVNTDAVEGLRADADALQAGGILRAVDKVLAVRDSVVELNLQHTLALEALFLELSSLTRG
jgi:DNA polymerase III subunit delta'